MKKPRGIIFIRVSGKPGSCFQDLAAAIVGEFDELKTAVQWVDDEPFHEAVLDCELCLFNKSTRPCRDCPHSLATNSLFRTCRLAADRLTQSKLYWKHDQLPRGFGVVLIQGRHVLHEESLCDAAPRANLVG